MTPRKKAALAIACLAGLFVLGVIYRFRSSPDGRYDASMIGADGYNYFEFKDGKVYEVITEANHRKLLATYSKVGGKWMIHPADQSPDCLVIPGLTSLQMYDAAGNEETSFPMVREWAHNAEDNAEQIIERVWGFFGI